MIIDTSVARINIVMKAPRPMRPLTYISSHKNQ